VVNNSRLNDFFAFEYTPSYCIYVILAHIQSIVTCAIDCLIGNHFIFVQMVDQGFKQLFRDEKFIIGFLEYIAILGSPSKLRIS
jgi:hypothetical protein